MLYEMLGPTKPKKKVTFHSPVITEPSSRAGYPQTSANGGKGKVVAKGKVKMTSTSTDDSSDALEWTQEEGRIICVRKSEGKSWAEIGKELGRGRRDCQQRHRILSSRAKKLGITTAKLAKLHMIEDEEKTKSEKSKSKENGEAKSDKANTKGKDKSKAPDDKEETTSKRKKKKNKEAPGSPSDSGSSSNDEDPNIEYWAQRRYIYDTMYGQMYPDQKVLRPDRFYSESDCHVLAGLEARYRANKWLYIQADFCNATGRMVDAEILKAKFYED